MIVVSTGYKRRLFAGEGFLTLFNGGCIELYTGAMPMPNLAPTGTLLARVSNNGLVYTPGFATNGLSYAVNEQGEVVAADGTAWAIRGLVAGTATWARMVGLADSGIASTDDPRVHFEVNPVDNNGIVMASPTIVVDAISPSTFFLYGIPPFA